jgi:flagellar basal-body rod modification protein FlgD
MSFASSILPVSSVASQFVSTVKTGVANVISGKTGASAMSTPATPVNATPAAASAATAAASAASAASAPAAGAPAASAPVSATQSNITGAQQSLIGDQNTFLTLLTAQLKNQDPLSPLDPSQFTQQLVQMTGVQQQILSNQLLQQLVTSQGGVGSNVSLIGKTVTAATSAATIQGGQASWSYSLNSNAADVSVQVVDNLGNVVWQGDAGAVTAGQHTLPWDGTNLQGNQLPDGGTYGLIISAKDSTGAAVGSNIFLQGQATSITQAGGVSYVTINGTLVPVTAVTSVATTS